MTDRTAIWKFPVVFGYMGFSSTVTIQMPLQSRILSAAFQGTELMLWAAVDTSAEFVGRSIAMEATGHETTGTILNSRFVGTVSYGPLVFHVFDLGEVS